MHKLVTSFCLLLIFLVLEVIAIKNLQFLKQNIHGDLINVLFILLNAAILAFLIAIEDASEKLDKKKG